MKSKLRNKIRSIILEQVDELFVDTDGVLPTRLAVDSADDQVDSFILKFEKDSIENRDSDSSLDESLDSLSLKFLLEQELPDAPEEEAPEDLAPAPEAPPAEDDAEQEDAVEDPGPEGSEDASDKLEPAESLPKPPIDIDQFTKRVARLAMNYENLIDMKTVIVNRALNFILDNYDKQHQEEMMEILNTQFDFDIDGNE